jgi:hypothetical protein
MERTSRPALPSACIIGWSMESSGMKARIILLLIAVWSLPRIVMAGGTLDADEVLDVIKQEKEIAELLASSLEFRCTAWSDNRLGSEVVPGLGGKRIGPYTLWARRRGSKEGWSLQLTVETRARLQDASGADLPDEELPDEELPDEELPGATVVKEELLGVGIKPCSEACDAQADQTPCLMSSGANEPR